MDWQSTPGQVEGEATTSSGETTDGEGDDWPMTSAGTIAWLVFGFMVAGVSHWVIAALVMGGIFWLNKQAQSESGA